MRTWVALIFLSTFAFLAFANMASLRPLEAGPLESPLTLDRAGLERKAAQCVEGKREALRTNNRDRYVALVTDMSCFQAEVAVYGER